VKNQPLSNSPEGESLLSTKSNTLPLGGAGEGSTQQMANDKCSIIKIPIKK